MKLLSFQKNLFSLTVVSKKESSFLNSHETFSEELRTFYQKSANFSDFPTKMNGWFFHLKLFFSAKISNQNEESSTDTRAESKQFKIPFFADSSRTIFLVRKTFPPKSCSGNATALSDKTAWIFPPKSEIFGSKSERNTEKILLSKQNTPIIFLRTSRMKF